MSDTQILTITIAMIIPLALLLLSNKRLTDMRTSLQGSIDNTRDMLRAEIKASHTELMAEIRASNAQMQAMNAFLHEAVMGKLDDLDMRLTRLEEQRGK